MLPPRPPPRPSTAVKTTSRCSPRRPKLHLPSPGIAEPGNYQQGKPSRPPAPPRPGAPPRRPQPAAHTAVPGASRPGPRAPRPSRARGAPHRGPYLSGEAAAGGRRMRTPRASEGEAERRRRGAERCTRPTAPAATGRGGRARARGPRHAPGPLPAPPVRAPDAPASRRPRRRPGSGGCTAQGGCLAIAAQRKPEASPSPRMVCPVGNAHSPLLSHQHKVLPHCGESLEARDDSGTAHSSPNSPESRSQRLVVAPSSQGLRRRNPN